MNLSPPTSSCTGTMDTRGSYCVCIAPRGAAGGWSVTQYMCGPGCCLTVGYLTVIKLFNHQVRSLLMSSSLLSFSSSCAAATAADSMSIAFPCFFTLTGACVVICSAPRLLAVPSKVAALAWITKCHKQGHHWEVPGQKMLPGSDFMTGVINKMLHKRDVLCASLFCFFDLELKVHVELCSRDSSWQAARLPPRRFWRSSALALS